MLAALIPPTLLLALVLGTGWAVLRAFARY